MRRFLSRIARGGEGLQQGTRLGEAGRADADEEAIL